MTVDSDFPVAGLSGVDSDSQQTAWSQEQSSGDPVASGICRFGQVGEVFGDCRSPSGFSVETGEVVSHGSSVVHRQTQAVRGQSVHLSASLVVSYGPANCSS